MDIHEQAKTLYREGYRVEGEGRSFHFLHNGLHAELYIQANDITLAEPLYSSEPEILVRRYATDVGFVFPKCGITDQLLLQMQAFAGTVDGFLCDIERMSEDGAKVVGFMRSKVSSYPPCPASFMFNERVSVCTILLVQEYAYRYTKSWSLYLTAFVEDLWELPTVNKILLTTT